MCERCRKNREAALLVNELISQLAKESADLYPDEIVKLAGATRERLIMDLMVAQSAAYVLVRTAILSTGRAQTMLPFMQVNLLGEAITQLNDVTDEEFTKTSPNQSRTDAMKEIAKELISLGITQVPDSSGVKHIDLTELIGVPNLGNFNSKEELIQHIKTVHGIPAEALEFVETPFSITEDTSETPEEAKARRQLEFLQRLDVNSGKKH